MDGLLQAQVDAGDVPGVVVLAGRCFADRPDVVCYRKAYGWREHTTPDPAARERMTVDTLFDLASLTKPTATAVAAMLLVQDGRLALTHAVARHLPDFAQQGKGDVTVRDLLMHTSGLPAYTGVPAAPPRPNADALLAKLCRMGKTGITGRDTLYSCLNYILLARIVEAVAGESIDAFLRRRLWQPLGMADTTFFPAPAQLARAALSMRARRGRVHDPLAYYAIDYDSRAHGCGNAGVFSTADDTARLLRLLLHGGMLGATRIFSPETAAALTSLQPPGAARTCAWWRSELTGREALAHTGYTGTYVWFDPAAGLYVIVLANSVYPDDSAPKKRAFYAARREAIRLLVPAL